MPTLPWPDETLPIGAAPSRWHHPGSNLCLDFHGDPARARLVLFSDGNHHMALHETLAAFRAAHPLAGEVFYTTTPPGVFVQMIEQGAIQLGNLTLTLAPHLVLGPPETLARLTAAGHLRRSRSFMLSRGNVLLVRRGNPLGIGGIADLARPEVRLFLSNPVTEAASHTLYRETLSRLAERAGVRLPLLDTPPERPGPQLVYGDAIHHREAPQALADGRADAALLYYHLALRYTRVFPERFEIVPLGGSAASPQPEAGNAVSAIHAGLLSTDAGALRLLEFLMGDETTAIYERHGLRRATDAPVSAEDAADETLADEMEEEPPQPPV